VWSRNRNHALQEGGGRGVKTANGRGVEAEEWRGKLCVMRARFRSFLTGSQDVRGLSPEASNEGGKSFCAELRGDCSGEGEVKRRKEECEVAEKSFIAPSAFCFAAQIYQ